MYIPAPVIVDDLAARRCAVALGIPVRGTLGLVLTAKQRGTIGPPTHFEQRCSCGMYLSNRVMNQALLVGNKSRLAADNLPGSTLWLQVVCSSADFLRL